MAYGDYDGPDKPNKGKEGGACNRTLCQAEPALYYNHGSYAWYCSDCAVAIECDPVNKRDWDLSFRPKCGHDQFETRTMIDAREGKVTIVERLPHGASFEDIVQSQQDTIRKVTGPLVFESTPAPMGDIGRLMYGLDYGSSDHVAFTIMDGPRVLEIGTIPPGGTIEDVQITTDWLKPPKLYPYQEAMLSLRRHQFTRMLARRARDWGTGYDKVVAEFLRTGDPMVVHDWLHADRVTHHWPNSNPKQTPAVRRRAKLIAQRVGRR